MAGEEAIMQNLLKERYLLKSERVAGGAQLVKENKKLGWIAQDALVQLLVAIIKKKKIN